MGLMRTTWAALLSTCLLAPAAAAQPADAPPENGPKKAATDAQPHQEGDYGGVEPGKSEFKPRTTRRALLSWLGFQQTEGGQSRLFFQFNQDAQYSQNLDDKNVLHVHLEGARYASRNTVRRLDTRYFDTPVAQVITRRVGKKRARKGKPGHSAGIVLSITFKSAEDAQQAQISGQKEADGYHYIYLGFGPAKERPASSDVDEPVSDDSDDVDDVEP